MTKWQGGKIPKSGPAVLGKPQIDTALGKGRIRHPHATGARAPNGTRPEGPLARALDVQGLVVWKLPCQGGCESAMARGVWKVRWHGELLACPHELLVWKSPWQGGFGKAHGIESSEPLPRIRWREQIGEVSKNHLKKCAAFLDIRSLHLSTPHYTYAKRPNRPGEPTKGTYLHLLHLSLSFRERVIEEKTMSARELRPRCRCSKSPSFGP